jgi:hypothetical protein
VHAVSGCSWLLRRGCKRQTNLSRDSFRLGWLELGAKSGPMSLAVALMIGRVYPTGSADVPSRSAARHRFSVLLKKTIGLGNLQYGEAHGVRASPALHGHVLYIQGSRVHDMVRSPPYARLAYRNANQQKCLGLELWLRAPMPTTLHALTCLSVFTCWHVTATCSHYFVNLQLCRLRASLPAVSPLH